MLTVERKSESRNNHQFASVVQDLAIRWIQCHPCETKTSLETKNSRKFVELLQKPKVIHTNEYLDFGKNYHGITQHLHHKCRNKELQNELFVELQKGHQPYYCDFDWMKSGGHIPWAAVAICEMSKTFWKREISVWTKIWGTIQRTNYTVWRIGWISPRLPKRQSTKSSIWKKFLPRFFLVMLWSRWGEKEKEILIAYIEELENVCHRNYTSQKTECEGSPNNPKR